MLVIILLLNLTHEVVATGEYLSHKERRRGIRKDG